MVFDSYIQGKELCARDGRNIDCVYIFYTTDEPRPIAPSLRADNLSPVCSDTLGVLRSKGVICKKISDNKLHITFTSKNGKRLGINTPEFLAGVKVYNIGLVVSGHTPEEDILMMSTELTPAKVIPAGSNIIMEVNLTLV
jgi:hypothetical protein